MRNNSVLFSLIGIMFLMIGFIGFMAHTFSNSTIELNGAKLTKTANFRQELEKNDKVCILSQIYSDDTFEMPDNHQKVIKGKLCLSAIWPDGSQTILINWQRKANYLRIATSDSTICNAITPKSIECMEDSAMAAQHIKITRTPKSANVEYYHYKFTLNGCYTKGQPQIVIKRECLENGANVAVTMAKENTIAPSNMDVISVVPYEKALAKESGLTKSKTIYLAIGIIGILMLFIPEGKTIDPLSKMMGNKFLSK